MPITLKLPPTSIRADARRSGLTGTIVTRPRSVGEFLGKAWLNGVQDGTASTLTMRLIDCGNRSSLRPMTFWCLRASASSSDA